MKYLIFGGTGLIGYDLARELVKKGDDVAYTYLKNEMKLEGAETYKLDLFETEKAIDLLKQVKPDVVVHNATVPNVDLCETNKPFAHRVNVETTEKIVDYCIAANTKIIAMSTAAVFPSREKPFLEDENPSAENYYAQTKIEQEKAIRRNGSHIIIRTDQIYGWTFPGQKKTYVEKVLEKIEAGQKTEVCEDWYNSPTYFEDLTTVIIKLMELEKNGIYHTVGNTFLNRVEWGKTIAGIFGADPNLVVGIDSSKINLPAKRTKNQLVNDKVQKETGVKLKTVDEGLKLMKKTRDEGGWR